MSKSVYVTTPVDMEKEMQDRWDKLLTNSNIPISKSQLKKRIKHAK